MEFKKIKIENFGGITGVTTEPKRVNVLIGPNGAGKSTFLKAIKFGLIGNATRTQLVKHGCTSATVEIDLDGVNIQTSRNSKGTTTVKVNGKRTSQKSVIELLENDYGATKESMKFLTSSDVFENATSSEFTEFLLNSGFIPLELDVEKFISVAQEETPLSSDLEAQIRKYFPEAPTKFDINRIIELNEFFSAQLKAEKKEVERLTAIVNSTPEGITVRDIATITKERDELVAHNSKVLAFVELKKKIADTQKKIAELQEIYDADHTVKPNPAHKSAGEKMRSDMMELIKKNLSLIAGFEENNKILSNQLARLEGNRCPLSDKLICGQDKTAVKAEIQSMIENNAANISVLQMDMESYENQREKAEKVINDYNLQEKAYNNKLSILKQINSLKESTPKEIPKDCEVDPTYREKLERLEQELAVANKVAMAKREQTNLEEHTKQREVYSQLEKLTSKKGNVKAKILKILLGTLVSAINEMADKVCPQIHMNLAVGSTGNVIIQCNTRTGVQDYADLSTGEKLLVQFLVMSQINQLSGFKLLILDNLDKLDSSNFENLLEFLNKPEIKDYYDHIFVAAVNHEDFKDVLDKHPEVNTIDMTAF